MLKILLVDDHKMLLEGLKSIMEKTNLDTSVQIISSPKNVIPFLNSNKIDIVITDLNMPEMSGFDLIKKIKQNHPFTKIGVLTMYYNPNIINELKTLDIDLYLHKGSGEDEFEIALQTLLNGNKYFSTGAKKFMFNDLKLDNGHSIKDAFIQKYILSPREFEIFKLIIENNSSQEISEKLFISKETVSTHRKSIIRKTGCKTVIELLKLAIEMGIDKTHD